MALLFCSISSSSISILCLQSSIDSDSQLGRTDYIVIILFRLLGSYPGSAIRASLLSSEPEDLTFPHVGRQCNGAVSAGSHCSHVLGSEGCSGHSR